MPDPARLLLIDDDPVLCRVVSRLVRSHYDVTSGQSVAEAQEMLTAGSYDLMLLDFRLPDGTGLDVCEAARAQGVSAPALLMSGYDAASIGPEAAKLGVAGFITKPFSEADLLKSLGAALAHGAVAPAAAVDVAPTPVVPLPPTDEKPSEAPAEGRFHWPWHRPTRKSD